MNTSSARPRQALRHGLLTARAATAQAQSQRQCRALNFLNAAST